MREITVENLKAFFKPVEQQVVEREAGLTPAALSKILSGKRQLKQSDIDKLKPILKKYNF